MNTILSARALVVIYAIANRIAGDGVWIRRLKWRGRPLWYAALGAFLALWPVIGWEASAWCASSFLCWRSLGWYDAIDAGTVDQTPERDFAVMTARGVLLFPIFLIGGEWIVLAICCVAIAGAYHAAFHVLKSKTPIEHAEWMAGALVGAGFAAALYL